MSVDLRCAISGEPFVPSSDAVVTPSGYVCERRLLLEKLRSNGGVDPFSSTNSGGDGDADPPPPAYLDETDLVPLQLAPSLFHKIPNSSSSSSLSRSKQQASHSSMGQLLHSLQEEYDGVLLELYDTRMALEETRRELSQALYQNDAAVRVVARLTMERDHARQKLTELATAPPVSVGAGEEGRGQKRRRDDNNDDNTNNDDTHNNHNDAETNAVPSQIPAADLAVMTSKWKELSTVRRKKLPPPSGHATASTYSSSVDVVAIETLGGLHKSNRPGITCLALDHHDDTTMVTGGNDRNVIVYDRKKQTEVACLTGANGPVTAVDLFASSTSDSEGSSRRRIVTGSEDGTVRIYDCHSSTTTTQLVGSFQTSNETAVVGVHVHPTQQYVLATSADGEIVVASVQTKEVKEESTCVVKVIGSLRSDTPSYKCSTLHPDGLILAAGFDGGVDLWDLSQQKRNASAALPNDSSSSGSGSNSNSHNNEVCSLSVSANGYHLAAATRGGHAYVLDMRKLGAGPSKYIVGTLSEPASTVAFDAYGKLLLTLSPDHVRVYAAPAKGTKSLTPLVTVTVNASVNYNKNNNNNNNSNELSPPMGVAWTSDANGFVSFHGKTVRFWGPTSSPQDKNNDGDKDETNKKEKSTQDKVTDMDMDTDEPKTKKVKVDSASDPKDEPSAKVEGKEKEEAAVTK